MLAKKIKIFNISEYRRKETASYVPVEGRLTRGMRFFVILNKKIGIFSFNTKR